MDNVQSILPPSMSDELVSNILKFKHVLTNEQLCTIAKSFNDEAAQREKNTKEIKKRQWTQIFNEIVPECEKSGIVNVVAYGDDSITLHFTPNFTIPEAKNKSPPYRISFSQEYFFEQHQQNTYWEISVNLNGVNSCTTDSRHYYVYHGNGKNHMIPVNGATGNPNDKHLPAILFITPWITRLLTEYKTLFEQLSKRLSHV